MSLDLYGPELSDAPAQPAPPPIDFGEGFWAAWTENQRFVSTAARERLRAEVLAERVRDLEAATGEQFPYLAIDKGFAHELIRRADAEYPKVRARHPDRQLPSLAGEDIEAEVVRRAGEARRARLVAEQRPSGFPGELGFVLGDIAGAATDPVNLLTLSLGASPAAGILRTALTEGALAMASQAAIEAGTGQFKGEADPDYGTGDALANIGMAGAGGALIGGGVRGLASLWSRLRGGEWPRSVQDAGNVVAREAAAEASAPAGTAGAEAVAHRTNLDAAEAALAADEPVQVPLDLTGGRTGQVFTAGPAGGVVSGNETRSAGGGPHSGETPVRAAAAQVSPSLLDADAGDGVQRAGRTPAQTPVSLRRIVEGREVVFPDRDHADLFAIAERSAAGEDIPAAELDGVLRRFRGFVVEEPVYDTNFAGHEDVLELAAEYRQSVLQRAGTGEPSKSVDAGDMLESDEARSAWRERTIREERAGRPGGTSTGRTFDATNRAIDVRYEIVEARDLVTSNLDDFEPNPSYPAELQPRDRTRAANQEQVLAIAGRLEPERLGPSPDASTGAPIVGPDDVVESGNGRVMALRRVYRGNGERAGAYRAFLARQGYRLDDFEEPVLVARRTTPLSSEERVAVTAAANRATAMRLSAGEQALADARLIDDRMLDAVQPGEPTSAGNRPFVRALAEKLPEAERGTLFDADGVLSQDGGRRVTAALLARAYGDPNLLGRLLEDTDSNMRAIGGAMADAAGPWAAMRNAVTRGQIPAGMDITRDLLAAFRLVSRARDAGRPLRELVEQADMFNRPSPMTRALLGFMFRDGDLGRPAGRAAMREALEAYVEAAMKNEAGPRLFGEALEAPDVLAAALRQVGRDDLVPLARQAVDVPAIDRALGDPQVEAAVLADADRFRGGPGAPPTRIVPLDAIDDAGRETVNARSLDDLLAEADSEIDAGAQLRACALGGAAETLGSAA